MGKHNGPRGPHYMTEDVKLNRETLISRKTVRQQATAGILVPKGCCMLSALLSLEGESIPFYHLFQALLATKFQAPGRFLLCWE